VLSGFEIFIDLLSNNVGLATIFSTGCWLRLKDLNDGSCCCLILPITYFCEAHHEMRSLCGAVSTVDPARETALCASRADSPNASSTEMASIAVRPTPPAQ
jgi:hypothetical protein